VTLVLQSTEIWMLRCGDDAVRCVASPHPMGVEVCYLINRQPLISRVLPDWSDVVGVADAWRERLESQGWIPSAAARATVRH
jgi:hypothetical protein